MNVHDIPTGTFDENYSNRNVSLEKDSFEFKFETFNDKKQVFPAIAVKFFFAILDFSKKKLKVSCN